MKKLFAVILCICLALCLAACGAETEDKKTASSEPTASSMPAIGTEIGSEPAGETDEEESSEEASSEEETFDPDGIYDTGKDPFLGEDTLGEYRYENGFEENGSYIISGGLDKFTANGDKIHGGSVSLCTRSDSLSQPDFYISVPELAAEAECELTLFVMADAAVEGVVEIHTSDSGAADATASVSGLTPGKWSSITVTFYASTADIHIKAPAGVTLYFDDLTLVYRQ